MCSSCYSGCTLAPSLLDLLHKVAIQLVSSYDQSDISWHAGKQMSEPKLSCGVSAAHVDRGWMFPLAHVLKRVFCFPPLLVSQIKRAQLAAFQLLPYIYFMETCGEGETGGGDKRPRSLGPFLSLTLKECQPGYSNLLHSGLHDENNLLWKHLDCTWREMAAR